MPSGTPRTNSPAGAGRAFSVSSDTGEIFRPLRASYEAELGWTMQRKVEAAGQVRCDFAIAPQCHRTAGPVLRRRAMQIASSALAGVARLVIGAYYSQIERSGVAGLVAGS